MSDTIINFGRGINLVVVGNGNEIIKFVRFDTYLDGKP